MRFIFCEDNEDTRKRFQTWWDNNRRPDLMGFELEFAFSKEEALDKINGITDDDIVSLDSRLPTEGDGDEILAALRQRECKCLVLWHSRAPVPDWALEHCFQFRQWDSETLIQLQTRWREVREDFEN